MLRLLGDENFDGTIVRGLLRRLPDIDLVRVQDVGLSHTDDPAILAWAAAEGRILLTHDRRTIPGFAFDRVRRNEPMPGVFVVDDRMPFGQVARRPGPGHPVQRTRRVDQPGRVTSRSDNLRVPP